MLINTIAQMLEKDLGRLIVADRENPLWLVGPLVRQEVLVIWMRWIENERVPEGGRLTKQVYAFTPLKHFARISRMVWLK